MELETSGIEMEGTRQVNIWNWTRTTSMEARETLGIEIDGMNA